MCGISGACCLHKRPKKEECLSGMLRSMRRRGPDARGIKITERAILFHTRLIVVDPENGAQPMTQKENGLEYTIVYNGELYNTEELRKELTAAGIEFFGHSDTEVVLKSYIHWGEKCLDRFNGIFAFAVWEEATQRLFFARDRMGVKPFFYALKNDTFIYGE